MSGGGRMPRCWSSALKSLMAAISSQKLSSDTFSCSIKSSVSASFLLKATNSCLWGPSSLPRSSCPSLKRSSKSCRRRSMSGRCRGVRQAAKYCPSSETLACRKCGSDMSVSTKKRTGGESGWESSVRRLLSSARSFSESPAIRTSSVASSSRSRFSSAFKRANCEATSDTGKATEQSRPLDRASASSKRAVSICPARLCGESSSARSTGCSPARVRRS
mmetsp:Transcript_74783/g.160259  ORF Transcript_74783/g.160259 Transcript_74783/m.160259 type:complete len:219 (+) Transcript_74783:3399-4055(+)